MLARLYDRLLGDLDGLGAYRSLVIVPHGQLHYVPFHALHDGDRYLVEQCAISYAPSAAVYRICRARSQKAARRGGALVLAHSGGGRLPFAVEEGAAVAAVLGASARGEAAATRAALEREGRRAAIIHIAAHGRFRPDAPLFSKYFPGEPLDAAHNPGPENRIGRARWAGTSFATPVVAGIAARLWMKHGNRTGKQIWEAIVTEGRPYIPHGNQPGPLKQG